MATRIYHATRTVPSEVNEGVEVMVPLCGARKGAWKDAPTVWMAGSKASVNCPECLSLMGHEAAEKGGAHE